MARDESKQMKEIKPKRGAIKSDTKMPAKGKPETIKSVTKNVPAIKKGLDKLASPKKTSYIGNVVKEVKQTAKAASNAIDKADRKWLTQKTGRKIDIKIGKSDVKNQVGQAAGAILQGRRYDNATGKQIKATPKKKGK